jgi:hypothetical protein
MNELSGRRPEVSDTQTAPRSSPRQRACASSLMVTLTATSLECSLSPSPSGVIGMLMGFNREIWSYNIDSWVPSQQQLKCESGQKKNSVIIFIHISFYLIGNRNEKVENGTWSAKFGQLKMDKSK